MKNCPRRVACASAVLLALTAQWVAPYPAAASDAAERLRARAERALAVNQADESRRADWEQVFREKFTALRDAQERLVRTEITYRDGKQRHRLRGSVKAELLAAIEVQQTEVANATEDLAELRERARVEGVPGGWIDAVEEELSSPASLN